MATADDDRCRALVRFGVYAALVLSPLPFGSVQPWAVFGLEILATALGLGSLWIVARDREALPSECLDRAPAFELREAPLGLLRPLYRTQPRVFLVVDGIVEATWSGYPRAGAV